MSANTHAVGETGRAPRRRYWQRMGGKFLVLSILAHLLFLAIATYCVIEYIVPARRALQVTLPPGNPAKSEADHRTAVKQQRETTSAPALSMRTVVQAPTDVVIPNTDTIAPSLSMIPGNISNGPGTNPFEVLGPSTFGPIGRGGPPMPPLGIKDGKPGMLKGTFYDFKFLRNGQPAKDPNKDYAEEITHFVMHGWNDSELGKYLPGSHPLFVSQVFFPNIETNDAPKAFNSRNLDSPGKWVVVYKGNVQPPETGTYHFVAAGDDDMIIRFNGRTVLFHCEHIPTPPELQGDEYHYSGERLAYARSLPLKVEAGKSYPLEILIGDDIPAKTFAKVLIEKEGVNYQKDPAGGPIVPVFALDAVTASGTETPAHLDGPVWQGDKSLSLLDRMQAQ